MHNIEDELIFTNHTGYIFHDSCGFEAGGENELKIVQEFVRRKSRERELKDRLHVIWFVALGIYNCKLKIVCQVLCPDGQCSAAAGFKVFPCYLP